MLLSLSVFLLLPLLSQAATSRLTEAQEATILSPTQECTSYDYAPVDAIAHLYPTIWQTATITNSSPAYDLAVYQSIASGIPNIAPRGNRAGDFAGVTYSDSDPDCWWSWNKCTTPKLAGLQDDIIRCEEPNTWGLTLDDGPNCSHNAYFDYLLTINQKATLFYIGSNVMDWPLEAQRGLSDGHEICAHTWSHPYMTALTDEEVFAELYYSKKAIKDVLGITVRCWRPPYGDVDDRVRYIASKLDLRTIIWVEDTNDYDWVTVGMAAIRKNYEAIIAQGTNGTYNAEGLIVLTHEIDNGTMALSEEFLPQIISTFKGGVMPVAVCMNNSQPYVEQNSSYVYPDYAQWAAGTRSVNLLAPTAVSKDIRLYFGSTTPAAAVSTATSTAVVTSITSSAGVGSSTSSSAKASSTSSKPSAGERVKVGSIGSLVLLALTAFLV